MVGGWRLLIAGRRARVVCHCLLIPPSGSVHQLGTPESTDHRASVTSLGWADLPVVDSMASVIAKSDVSEDVVSHFYLWV
jgi:hypothetical protein